jgi:hypothetical protein
VPEVGPDEVLVEIKKTVRASISCRSEADKGRVSVALMYTVRYDLTYWEGPLG